MLRVKQNVIFNLIYRCLFDIFIKLTYATTIIKIVLLLGNKQRK